MVTYKLPKGVVQLGYIPAAYYKPLGAALRTLAPIVPALRAFGQVAGPLRVPPVPRAILAVSGRIPPFNRTLFAAILDTDADRLGLPRDEAYRDRAYKLALGLAKLRHRRSKIPGRFYDRRGNPGTNARPLTDAQLLAFEANRLRVPRRQYLLLAFRLSLERRRIPDDRPLNEIRPRRGRVWSKF